MEQVGHLRRLRPLFRVDDAVLLPGERPYAHEQAAGENGRQDLLRLERDQQEQGLLRRFLDHLQEGVRRLRVHLFGQIDHDRPVSAFHGGQGQLVQDGARLIDRDEALLPFDSDGRIELVLEETGVLLSETGLSLAGPATGKTKWMSGWMSFFTRGLCP